MLFCGFQWCRVRPVCALRRWGLTTRGRRGQRGGPHALPNHEGGLPRRRQHGGAHPQPAHRRPVGHSAAHAPPFGWMPRRASYFWPALYWQAQDGELAAAWCLWFAGLVVGWSPPRCWKYIFEIMSDERLSFVSGVPLEVLLRVLNRIPSPQPHPGTHQSPGMPLGPSCAPPD